MGLKSRVARTVRGISQVVVRPPWMTPGHYYSPMASPSDIERATGGRRSPVGIDLRRDEQLALVSELGLEVPPIGRWSRDGNTMFGASDAAILRAIMTRYRPDRITEVGSGFSTAVMLDVADDLLPDLAIRCVEPYPARLKSLLRPGDEARIDLLERPVQELDPTDLVSGLGPGDIFFIDSTHVVKPGSDVVHLLLHTLPLLPKGVLVHLHDIFWPFEYPDEWLREGRNWTESYLLQAFLIHNPVWRIVLFGAWFWDQYPTAVPDSIRSEIPSSIWLERVM